MNLAGIDVVIRYACKCGKVKRELHNVLEDFPRCPCKGFRASLEFRPQEARETVDQVGRESA